MDVGDTGHEHRDEYGGPRHLRPSAELALFVLDHVLPALEWYRTETARCLGLAPRDLACLDLLRRAGPLRGTVLAHRLGRSRSTLATMLARLEAAGHLARDEDPDDARGVLVRLCPHAERDARWERLRTELAMAMNPVAPLPGGRDADDRAAHRVLGQMAACLLGVADAVFGEARRLALATGRLEHRRETEVRLVSPREERRVAEIRKRQELRLRRWWA